MINFGTETVKRGHVTHRIYICDMLHTEESNYIFNQVMTPILFHLQLLHVTASTFEQQNPKYTKYIFLPVLNIWLRNCEALSVLQSALILRTHACTLYQYITWHLLGRIHR